MNDVNTMSEPMREGLAPNAPPADALVFFSATGDLAHKKIFPAAQLSGLLRYIDGDYGDPTTFQQLRRELGAAKHPLHYLAIPPSLFESVIDRLGESGCTRGARL